MSKAILVTGNEMAKLRAGEAVRVTMLGELKSWESIGWAKGPKGEIVRVEATQKEVLSWGVKVVLYAPRDAFAGG